jgi:hypothetical protein
MRRRWWIPLGAAAALSAVAAFVFRPRAPEAFPLAELVPADAVFYAGFRDLARLEALLPLLPADPARRLREGLDSARPHLSGGAAVYLDREGQWVFLARLTRASALVAGGEVENGAAVVAQTPEALARHKARKGALAGEEAFRRLRSSGFLNVRALRLPGRFRDFEAAGFEVESVDPLVVRGKAAYRGSVLRLFLEQYVQAPGQGPPPGDSPAAAAFTEHFPRLWEEFVADLSPMNRERAEREAATLSQAFLRGRGLKEFFKRVGPSCGLQAVPTPHGFPALVLWIELAGEETRDLLGKMLHRAAQDAKNYAREKGEAPFVELSAEGAVWRVRFPGQAALRLGEAFTPAYTFEKNRIVLSTCASALQAPPPSPGPAHASLSVDVARARELLLQLAPLLADGVFRDEAARQAERLYREMFTPDALAALRRQTPDASDRDRILAGHRAQLEARALGDLAKSERYAGELERQKARLESWAAPFSRWDRLAASARFTGEGLEFELRASTTE